jgi:hypothetical protein
MAYTVGRVRSTRRRAPKRLCKVPRCLVRRHRQPVVQWPDSTSSASLVRDVKQQTYSLADDKPQLEDLWRSETLGDEPKKLQKGGCSPSHGDKSVQSRGAATATACNEERPQCATCLARDATTSASPGMARSSRLASRDAASASKSRR